MLVRVLLLDTVATLALSLERGSVLAGLHTAGQIWLDYTLVFALILRRLLIASEFHVPGDGFSVGALGLIMLLNHLSRLFNCVQRTSVNVVSGL